MKKDEAARSRPLTAANDNSSALAPAAVDAALRRIAEAIGRHLAREHIDTRKAANDNDVAPKNPKAPKH